MHSIKLYHNPPDCQGTGSYPHPPHGLQRTILFIPSHIPCITPYRLIAILVYSLHVGVNLQTALPPNNGEIARWYRLINAIEIFFTAEFILCVYFLFTQVIQCFFHCDPSVCSGRIQYITSDNENIVPIITHHVFVKLNPVPQQSFCPISVDCMLKVFFCNDNTEPWVIWEFCCFCPHQEKSTACHRVVIPHCKVDMIFNCISFHSGYIIPQSVINQINLCGCLDFLSIVNYSFKKLKYGAWTCTIG